MGVIYVLHTAEPQAGPVAAPRPTQAEEVRITWEQATAYLDSLKGRGCTADTIQTYRRNLLSFFRALPPDHAIGRESVARWRDALLASGYMPRTVNLRLSSANGFLGFLGLREYQLPTNLPPPEDDVQPELTRNEYLRLLAAARALGKERAYLMTKVFATTGLAIHELPRLTAEAVREGRIVTAEHRQRRAVRVPDCLRGELADFVRRTGPGEGPVFVSRRGKALNRTAVTAAIQGLAQDARVAADKCNPRCLRKLYQATQEGIRANMDLLAEQSYERLLEQEQITIGWEEVDAL